MPCDEVPQPVQVALNPEISPSGQDYTRAWRTVSDTLTNLQVSLFNLQGCVNGVIGLSASTTVTPVGATGTPGVLATYSRGDHQHPGVHSLGGATGDITLGANLSIAGNVLSASGGGGGGGIVCALILSGAVSQAFPALPQQWLNSDLYCNIFDVTHYTEARLVVIFPMSSPVPVLPPNISAKYSINSGVSWNYLCGGTDPTVGYSHSGASASPWFSIAAGAITAGDVLLTVFGANGDGITNLPYGNVAIEVRP